MRYSLHSVQTQESKKSEAISRNQYACSYLGTMCSHSFHYRNICIKNVLLAHKPAINTSLYFLCKHRRNEDYPFGAKGKVAIKLTGAAKMGLDESEIKKLEELDLSKRSEIYNHARNIWLTEFYFAGMRVTDCLLLKWNGFQSGRLYYQMSKNGESGSVKIPAKAVKIIEQYRKGQKDTQNLHDLVFPFLWDVISLDDRMEVRRKIAFTVKRLNDAMVKIMKWIGSTKNASQHKARHSFAQRAEEKEIHPKYCKKCIGMKVC